MKPFYLSNRWFACLLTQIAVGASACMAVLIDDFNDNALSEQWISMSSGCELAETSNYLQVSYERSADASPWNQIRCDLESQPTLQSVNIRFKVWVDVPTRMIVTLFFSNGTSVWRQSSVGVSTGWNDRVLHYNLYSTRQVESIGFQFNGDNVNPGTGYLVLDDVYLSSGADISDYAGLVSDAERTLANMETGTAPGQYSMPVHVFFEGEVAAARTTLALDPIDQDQIEAARQRLLSAYTTIERNQNKEAELFGVGKNNAAQNRTTRVLFENLRSLAPHRILFGAQDPSGYGVGWNGDNRRSDIQSVCGAYPAFASWSIKDVANGRYEDDLRDRITFYHSIGAVNSLEWHMDNPLGGNFYWSDRVSDENPVAAILPGGQAHGAYVEKLDRIALFLKTLKDAQGQSIPVIFRPFHESTGDWFWWGAGHSTPDEFKRLFSFTVNYLRGKGVSNILVAYSTDRFNSAEHYLERYPGDPVVDILATDDYWDLRYYEGSLDIQSYVTQLRTLVELAEARGKVAALSETGYEGILYDNWYTEVLLDPIKADPVASRIAYMAVWRNANTTHHYQPYPGHSSVENFLLFYADPVTIFADEHLPDLFSHLLTVPEILNPGVPVIPVEPIPSSISLTSVEAHVSLELGKTATQILVVDEAGNLMLQFDGEYDAFGFSMADYLNGMYAIQVNFGDGTRETVLYLKVL